MTLYFVAMLRPSYIFANLSSTCLTDIDFKAKEGIPYKQQLVLNALETQACIQNPDKPEDCYFYASTLKGKVTDSKGVD